MPIESTCIKRVVNVLLTVGENVFRKKFAHQKSKN